MTAMIDSKNMTIIEHHVQGYYNIGLFMNFHLFIHFLDWFYVGRGSIIAALFGACIFGLSYSSSLLSLIGSAVMLGLFWQQLAFVGHDLGHHVVTHNKRYDDIISIFIGNFLQGNLLVVIQSL